MLQYDLIVIGGGPAGASAAIMAGRSGARVLLIERGRFPRHKVCGEFVSAESLGLLGELLDQRHAGLLADAIRIPRARVFFDGRTIETSVDPPAASIARFELDPALWEGAMQAGVETRQQTVVQVVTGTGPFRVKTSAGDFDTRAAVNASGRWSNLNPVPAENGRPREKWLGLKGHFAEHSPSVSVDLYFFEGGYCGVQPVDLRDTASKRGRINACAMVRSDVASTLPEVFVQHPALQERARGWEPLSEPVSTSPLLFRDPQPVRDHIWQAGDAAGFVDPFVGDGISLALRSGALAARCLIPFLRGETSLLDATEHYRQSYGTQLAPVFRASARIRRMLLLPRAVLAPVLLLLENMPVVTRYIVSKTR
jgi:flavin-dependent dehydrogenase